MAQILSPRSNADHGQMKAIFLGPPLWFDEVHTGYMYTGPFVGAILGFLLAGLLADWSAKIMIRRNKGVYEPEFRILLVAAQLVFGCAGLYGFGITAKNVAKYGWFWPDFFYALEVMGMVLGAVSVRIFGIRVSFAGTFLSPETCHETVCLLYVFQSSLHPANEARLTPQSKSRARCTSWTPIVSSPCFSKKRLFLESVLIAM